MGGVLLLLLAFMVMAGAAAVAAAIADAVDGTWTADELDRR